MLMPSARVFLFIMEIAHMHKAQCVEQSRSIIASLEEQTPGARHGLLHALEQIRELHRAAKIDPHTEVSHCQECGEITSRPICQTCTMKVWLKESQ